MLVCENSSVEVWSTGEVQFKSHVPVRVKHHLYVLNFVLFIIYFLDINIYVTTNSNSSKLIEHIL